MSLRGARCLVLISKNPPCEVLASMVADATAMGGDRIGDERDFYTRVTCKEFKGEYGQRLSSRRRGHKFEANLYQNDAALLRNAVAPIYDLDPVAMVVRNFENEGISSVVRRARTKRVLEDLADGKPVPDLLIQPALLLRIGGAQGGSIFIKPDFLVLDPKVRFYVPGEIKSFIVRDGVGDPGDLDRTRRQAGVEIIALRDEATLVGLSDRVLDRAVFVFATPYGLTPHEPYEEQLRAEVQEIKRAIRVLRDAQAKLKRLREPIDAPLEMLLDELGIHYQEGCLGNCILAGPCKERYTGKARLLGDAATDLLGADADLSRIYELHDGAPPRTAREAAIAEILIRAEEDLGFRAPVA